MKHKDFDNLVDRRIKICKETLGRKKEEYATHDRLHNFKVASRLQGTSAAMAAWNMATKHFVSILDMIQDPMKATTEMMDKKFTDAVNYFLLMEACVKEQRDAMMVSQAISSELEKRLKEGKTNA